MALGGSTFVQIRKWHDQGLHRPVVPEDLPEQNVQDHLMGCHWVCDCLLHRRGMHKYLAMRVSHDSLEKTSPNIHVQSD